MDIKACPICNGTKIRVGKCRNCIDGLRRPVQCVACNSTGMFTANDGSKSICKTCKGLGGQRLVCKKCKGTGEYRSPCKRCNDQTIFTKRKQP